MPSSSGQNIGGKNGGTPRGQNDVTQNSAGDKLEGGDKNLQQSLNSVTMAKGKKLTGGKGLKVKVDVEDIGVSDLLFSVCMHVYVCLVCMCVCVYIYIYIYVFLFITICIYIWLRVKNLRVARD